ncbi:hypothetical protein ACJW30_09G077000 [Castanea mollissima]
MVLKSVTCSKEGRVIGLNLFNESITAGLDNSSSLFSLKYLENLNLAYNCFNSPIPTEFRKLKNLSYLNLSNACFAGQIPNAISSLTRLVTLDLSTLYFLADSMLKLEDPNLAMLVQNLSELKELYLDGVNISVQGYEWCQALLSSLPNLMVLSMSGCSLSGPFEFSLSKLQSLSIISLYNNPFNAPVPEFFANFTSLTSLELGSCGLNGTFPKKIFQIQTLQKLDLSGNDLLQGSLPEFLSNGSLQSLLLGITNFSGTLPDSIGNLPMLSTIDLPFCNFSGSIPNSMENLVQLKDLLNLVYLDLGYNSLEGNIPVSLFSLPSLQTLLLSNNQFSGQLNEVSNVSSCQLKCLDLSSNCLEGSIPINKLHGSIPLSLCTARFLQVLNLSNNTLNGTIPQCLINISKNLGLLDVRRNKLSGTISDIFPGICGLQTLNLNGNLLEGVVPRSLANSINLVVFDIGNKHIKDAFPCYLMNISKLPVLILRSYKFYGSIDCGRTSDKWPMLQIVDLASNKFTGQLQIKSLSTKAMLNDEDKVQPVLNHIQFEVLKFSQFYYQDAITVTSKGPIPEEIGELKSLYVLNLSHNAFTNSIPPSLGNLSHLESLDLSSNRLTGAIPMQLADGLTFLSVLNLSFNQLMGQIPQIKQFATFLETS